MEEIKEVVQEVKDEVAVDEAAAIEEVRNAIESEPIENSNKKELVKDICELYGLCYKFSEEQLQGRNLKEKFEQLEQNLRKYRNVQEAALEKIKARRDEVKRKYEKAAKEFENMSLEVMDPSKYDSDVAPLESEYLALENFCNNKQKQIQGVKHITTKLFAKDKTQIPSIIHAQSILMCVRILQKVYDIIKTNSEVDFSDAENHITIAKKILENPAIVGDITAESDIETIVSYFTNVAQHSVDKQASISRESKKISFNIIDKICTELGIVTLEPIEEVEEVEKELMIKANQLKALETVLRGTKVKNPDGTFCSLPDTKQKGLIIDAMKHASIFLSDVSNIMDEKFLEQLPFKHDSIVSSYKDTVEKLSKTVFGEEVDTVFRRQLVAWVLYSTSVIDKIPLLLLYM